MKKILSICMALVMLCTCFAPNALGASITFSDVTDATQKAAIEKLADLGYVKGYPDGTFRPNASVLRSELVRMVNQVFKYVTPGINVFQDVADGQWYYQDLLSALKVGYISGFPDGTFRPSDSVTREQVCVILNKIEKFSGSSAVAISDTVSPWAYDAVEALIAHNIFSLESGNTFRATQNITRGELCVALAKLLDLKSANADTSGSTTDSGSTSTSSGGTSSGSSGGSGTSSNSTEVKAALSRVISALQNDVLPNVSTTALQKTVQFAISNLNAYEQNSSFDYKTAASKFKTMFSSLSSSEQMELTNIVTKYCSWDDLYLIKDYFGF